MHTWTIVNRPITFEASIEGSPFMVGFHSVAKCLRALSESQRVNLLLVTVTCLHLLVVGASCHLPDLDRHHVCYVCWELRVYQGGKIELIMALRVYQGGKIELIMARGYSPASLYSAATHILRDLSCSLEEFILACGHVVDGSLQVFTAYSFL